MTNSTPFQLGYSMPAEWEPHGATWLAWPHNPEDWPGKFHVIPWLYAEIVRLLARHELVHLIVEDACAQHSQVRGRESRPGEFPSVADGPWMDARLGANFCA
jgi:agmatine deiminase